MDIDKYLRDDSKWRKPPKEANRKKAFDYANHGCDLRYREKTVARDIVLNGRLIRVWHPEARSDRDLLLSLSELSRYPDVYPYIAIMPDYHIGESAVNGAVIPSRRLLYINIIGGDIGCGMASMRLPIRLDAIAGMLRDLFGRIHERVPSGRRIHLEPSEAVQSLPLFTEALEILNKENTRRGQQEMGTLGGGNHFVEIQKNEAGELNVMVHTGSRILGQHIRNIFIKRGQRPGKPPGLFMLEADSPEGRDYLAHVAFAVRYARENRLEILRQVYHAFQELVPQLREMPFARCQETVVDKPHNYISKETHFGEEVYVHRKGAIHVPENCPGLIPGSMGTSSFLVVGRGNLYSFNSCSHGAGRRLSRGKALRQISKEDFLRAMAGIVSRADDSILDEAPQAYKDIHEIIRCQRDLVRVAEEFTPVISIKG